MPKAVHEDDAEYRPRLHPQKKHMGEDGRTPPRPSQPWHMSCPERPRGVQNRLRVVLQRQRRHYDVNGGCRVTERSRETADRKQQRRSERDVELLLRCAGKIWASEEPQDFSAFRGLHGGCMKGELHPTHGRRIVSNFLAHQGGD